MPFLIISIEGTVVKEITLTKPRTTLGRRPHNDIVMENLAVSGEHAALVLEGDAVIIEDLGSTNGTFVNGFPVKRQVLADKDTIQIGKYKIRFEQQHEDGVTMDTGPRAVLDSSFSDF